MSFRVSKEEANRLYSAGDYGLAVSLYSSLIDELVASGGSTGDELRTLYSNRSAAHHQLDLFTEALVDAKACVACDAGWGKGYIRLGDAAASLGLWKEAVEAYRTARGLDPSNATLAKKLEEAEEEKAEEEVNGNDSGRAPTILPFGLDPMEAIFAGIPSETARSIFFQAMQQVDPAAADGLLSAIARYDADFTSVQHVLDAIKCMRASLEGASRRNAWPAVYEKWMTNTLAVVQQGDQSLRAAGRALHVGGLSQTAVDALKAGTTELTGIHNAMSRDAADDNNPSMRHPRVRALRDQIDANTRYLPGSSQVTKRVFVDAVLQVANSYMIGGMHEKMGRPAHDTLARLAVCAQELHKLAAIVSWAQGGWKYTADAHAYRGIGYWLRGTIGEAVKDMTNALHMAPKRWIKMSLLNPMLTMMLKQCRYGLDPLLGNFLPMPCSGLAGRFAASSVQIGSKLYVFGGMRVKPGREDKSGGRCPYFAALEQIRQAIDDGTISDVILNDLICFDFSSNSWTVIDVQGMSPSPRCFSLLAAHPSKAGTLMLLGGHKSLNGCFSNYSELWHFSLASRQWTKIKTKRCPLKDVDKVVGHVVLSNRWYLVTPIKGSVPEIHILDLASLQWSRGSAGSSGPVLENCQGVSFFIEKTSRLHIWAREAMNDGMHDGKLWALEMARGGKALSWKKFATSANGAPDDAFKLRGMSAIVFGEASVCVDQESQRAYIFGGWHDEFDQFSVMEREGTPYALHGRYTNVLLEIDLLKRTIRAVEAAGSKALGPSKRGFPLMGLYNNRILIAGGYTTLNVSENTYTKARHMSDEWIVTILKGGTTGTTAPKATTFQVRLDDVLDNAMRAPLQDLSLRHLLASALPLPIRASGLDHPVLFINCMDVDGSLLSFPRIFEPSNMPSVAPSDLLRRFPTLESLNPEPVKQIKLANRPGAVSQNQIHVLFYCDHTMSDGRTLFQAGGFSAAPVQWGFYHRPVAAVNGQEFVYTFADNGNPTRVGTEVRNHLSAPVLSASETRPAIDPQQLFRNVDAPGTVVSNIECCGFPDCPNASIFHAAAVAEIAKVRGDAMFVPPAAKPPKLLRCSRCMLEQYCSSGCQKAHFPAHKDACKNASASGK